MKKAHLSADLIAAAVICLVLAYGLARRSSAQVPSNSARLKIANGTATPLELSAADLKGMPRTTLKTVNPHGQKPEVYEGVAIQQLLHRVGVPDVENMRGAVLSSYVVAEASDGYRVVFSLAELDPGILDSEVIVADTMDGAPLDEKHGPFQLVVPHDKRAARWVRMLKSLTVSQAGK